MLTPLQNSKASSKWVTREITFGAIEVNGRLTEEGSNYILRLIVPPSLASYTSTS